MRIPRLLCLVLAVALLAAVPAAAQFPTTMNYQVMLTNDSDEPLADQAVELMFRLYASESSGVAVWTETHNTSTNGIGVVSVLLGSTTPLPYESIPGLPWLEVEVEGEIMSPRRELAAASHAFEAFNSRRLGGLSTGDYATDAELATPGTINDSENPVDWTNLKSVPAGFADGTDDVGGSGDGHSLDAWDGDPVDAVWVAGQGKVGIGTTSPLSTLHVHNDTLSSTAIRLTTPESGMTTTDGFVMALSPFGGGALLANYEGAPIYIGSGGASGLTIRSDTSVDIGNGVGQPGELSVYGSTSYITPLHRSYEDTYGGQFELTDEAGNVAVTFGADDSGTGGRLLVSRDATYGTGKGIDLNGNWSFTEEPALRVIGSSRSVRLHMNYEGNSSVQLPQDSIYDAEILDEPGVASATLDNSVLLTAGASPVISQSITTPTSGYVLVIVTCQSSVYHTNGTLSSADLGVSNVSNSFPPNQELKLKVDSAAPTGSYEWPTTLTGLFSVGSAGTYTYYMLGNEFSGNIIIYDMQMSLVFLPTAYGTVEPTLASSASQGWDEIAVARGPVTEAEVAVQRAEAEAFNLARIERELAEIQAQVEAMKEERQ